MSPTPRFQALHSLKRIAVLLLASVSAFLLALMFFERSLLFPAPSPEYGDWTAERSGARESFTESENGSRIHTWTWLVEEPRATIIFSHGNGEHLGFLGDEMLEMARRLRVNVVAYDYRGYGKSIGKPSETNVLEDAVTIATAVQSDEKLSQVPVLAMGRSLGGAAAIEMALRCRVDGLILDRTFSSIADVASHHFPLLPVRWLMRNKFYSDRKINNYRGELLQMHGLADEVVPIQFGERLFAACPSSSKQFLKIDHLTHNESAPDEFWHQCSLLIDRVHANR
ncbi:alpha/beta hydrolase [Pirellulaceae bacterium SH449]